MFKITPSEKPPRKEAFKRARQFISNFSKFDDPPPTYREIRNIYRSTLRGNYIFYRNIFTNI